MFEACSETPEQRPVSTRVAAKFGVTHGKSLCEANGPPTRCTIACHSWSVQTPELWKNATLAVKHKAWSLSYKGNQRQHNQLEPYNGGCRPPRRDVNLNTNLGVHVQASFA